MADESGPRTAESYRIHKGGLDVDGQPFPWHVIAGPGPMVQRMSDMDDMHILWLPILVDAALPPESTPPVALPEWTACDGRPCATCTATGGDGRG